MPFTKALLLMLLTAFCFLANAQYDGELKFIGRNFLNNKPLSGTKIRVVNGNKTVAEFETEDNTSFNAKLDYGNVYDIYFMNPRCQTMFIRIFADGVPEEKRYYKITYALDIPFFTKDPKLIDTTQFVNPFHQVHFDGKSKFVDDTAYMNRFIKKIYTTPKPIVIKKDTTIPFLTTEKIREYLQLAGKFSLDNDKQTPLKNKTVSLLNKKGQVIFTAQTTKHGAFVFEGVDLEEADGLTVTINSEDNPNHYKVRLQRMNSDTIESVSPVSGQTYLFKNNQHNELITKLKDNDFTYNIAGKLVATKGTDRKIASNTTVYLLNEKNTVIQRIKTNVLGTFLFTGIVPGKTYSIAYDSADTGPDFVMNLFSMKDKFIRRLDSISGKKFVYKFLSISNSSFNDLVMDDSELKMNVTGRLYGNNKNNPLVEMKVILLNDKYQTIDSAVTNKDGDFSFKRLSYTKQFLISAENEKNILESFDNILVFDNADNLIKIVSQIKGQKFNYKPLEVDKHRLTEIYVDDPWLKIIEQENASKNKPGDKVTIIENILFEFNKAELPEQSKQTLDKVVLAMLRNKKFDIELSAHSDSKGGDAYNLKLSEQRAHTSKLYIISKGIDEMRINAKGYGETRLLNNCGNTSVCSDDEHAVNRRLEFKLIFN
jgi:outer membrane protein OmpA-like peptidoglycan-associated protein